MNAADPIVDMLAAAGLNLSLTADKRLHVTPANRLTSELAHLIRANKPQLVDWLRAANDAPAPVHLIYLPYKKGETANPGEACNSGKDHVSNATLPGDAPMSSGEVETFTARVQLFMRRGLAVSHAEALADKFKRRDREGDDRRCCIECRCLSNRTCTAWRKAGLCSPQVAGLTAKLQRCPAFAPAITITEDHHD